MPISVEPTPNPNAMKFTVGTPVGGPATFKPDDSTELPWISSIFENGNVVQVFIASDFISVTKNENAVWDTMIDNITNTIKNHFNK